MDIQIAISQDFLTAILRLPKAQQKKVNQFVNKFRSDPLSTAINYEKINDAANSDMRSVRIDQAYRGIILKPQQGNVYILLWVDHHDEAYAWARRHHCKIHPKTGAIQLYATEVDDSLNEEIEENRLVSNKNKTLLFQNYSPEQLINVGLPKEFVQKIKQLNNIQQLESFRSRLPNDAFEALYFLADGIPYEEVLDNYSSSDDGDFDTEDFVAALAREGSKRRFVIVDDESLIQMLNAPLEKWRVFLHPSQRKLVEKDWNGPVRVLGGAGTGKTVTAIHRAKWLASNLAREGNKKILFTTFTKNLASDITTHLEQICTEDELALIEIINIDSWVHKFLKRNNYNYDVAYPGDSNIKRVGCWKKALNHKSPELDLDNHFYEDEWKLVVQEQNIKTKADYLKVKRNGRGTRLNRRERVLVWPVFEAYIEQLKVNGIKEMPDAIRDCISIIDTKKIKLGYSSVIVDEGQDIGSQSYELIRRIVPSGQNDIFIVGDGHQRIYRNKVVLGQCGIHVVGRSRKLRVNYRTTEETKRLAVSVLNKMSVDDLDNGQDSVQGYVSLMHGDFPEIITLESFEEETKAVIERIRQLEAAGADLKDICIVARTKYIRDAFGSALNKAGIKTLEIRANDVDERTIEGVRLSTMHRVKGLEFQNVFIVGCDDQSVPLVNFSSKDPVELREHEMIERALLHVAMTRAIRSLTITCHGKLTHFLNQQA
jgi:superfamily I DNA/RNA helicase/mRNA-degrading endonuclease RelE of RelBE toxin-antitoxin system